MLLFSQLVDVNELLAEYSAEEICNVLGDRRRAGVRPAKVIVAFLDCPPDVVLSWTRFDS